MVGLCIAEGYYLFGLFRVEYFNTLEQAQAYRGRLDQRVTTWILGEEPPRRKVVSGFY